LLTWPNAQEDDVSGQYIVIVPPPTPNGNLHLGHIAGPFIAGDVFSRHCRDGNGEVLFTTGTDDNQSYVVTAANRKGCLPGELCEKSTREIQDSLRALHIGVDGFAPFDAAYRKACVEFLVKLHKHGKFTWKDREFFVLPDGTALFEAFVKGRCPVCLAETSGGLCESCGHPNNYTEILDPFCTLEPAAALARKTFRILVFELEHYRAQLGAYVESRCASWRPHIRELLRDLLNGPLPEFPITYPGSWGIPAPFAGADGQVINAWAEGMPASMYCTAVAARNLGVDFDHVDDLWKRGSGNRLVYFLGFDNSYFWAMSHLALLMAHDGKYILPEVVVPNEFYELENEKFSTSRGHVLWASEVARQYDADAIRFYLCHTNPEHHRTNFGRREMEKLVAEDLITTWSLLVDNATELTRRVAQVADRLPTSRDGKMRATIMRARLSRCYALETFSLREAANQILVHIERLEKLSTTMIGRDTCSAGEVGDFWLQLLTLLRLGSPILTCWERCPRVTPDENDAFSVQEIRRLELPRLHLAAQAVPHLAQMRVEREAARQT
jgi:methionyl-tRNA synthetase